MKRTFWNRGGGLPFFLLGALGLAHDIGGFMPRSTGERDRDKRSMGFVRLLKDEAESKRERRRVRNLRSGGF